MFLLISRSSSVVVLLALLMPVPGALRPIDPPPPEAHQAQGVLGLLVAELLAAPLVIPSALPAAPPDGETLNDLTAEKIAKTQSSIAKATKKKAKLDAKLAARTLALNDAQQILAQLLASEPAALTAFADATDAVADALALPTSTPEEKAARKLALNLAKKAAKAAKKTLKKTQKGITKTQKKVSKTQAKVDALSVKSADLAATIDALEAILAQLTTPFDFQLTELVLARVQVQDTLGMPIPYARVSWMDALSLPDQGGSGGTGSQPTAIDDVASVQIYGEAFADETGLLETSISIPVHLQQVDVIVNADGYTGPYTDEALRDLWDVFAPSARIAVPRADLADLTITLTEDDGP